MTPAPTGLIVVLRVKVTGDGVGVGDGWEGGAGGGVGIGVGVGRVGVGVSVCVPHPPTAPITASNKRIIPTLLSITLCLFSRCLMIQASPDKWLM